MSDKYKEEYRKLPKTKHDTDLNYHIFGHVMRPWGYEVRIAIFDDNDNHTGSITMTWPKEAGIPTDTQIAQMAVARMTKYKEMIDNPPPEPVPEYFMERGDLEAFLVGRGYLEDGQALEDLPDLTPETVEVPTWRKVWNFLNQPLWGG